MSLLKPQFSYRSIAQVASMGITPIPPLFQMDMNSLCGSLSCVGGFFHRKAGVSVWSGSLGIVTTSWTVYNGLQGSRKAEIFSSMCCSLFTVRWRVRFRLCPAYASARCSHRFKHGGRQKYHTVSDCQSSRSIIPLFVPLKKSTTTLGEVTTYTTHTRGV